MLSAEVVDRIAVAVGNRAIKESQIDREIRLTAFLNGATLDFSAPSKRKAADRLIDQTNIRAEMAKGSYAAPSEAEVSGVLTKIKRARFSKKGEFEQALQTYGITEQELKAHVAWQIQVLHFIDLRFLPAARVEARVNEAFFSWLDESRKHERIQFHDEVFQ
jgi:hypothetical protein